jgi:hypothetical protein
MEMKTMTDFNVYQDASAAGHLEVQQAAEQQIAQLTAQLLQQQAALAAASKYKLFTVVAVGLASTALVGGFLYSYGKAFSANTDSMNENFFAQNAKPEMASENNLEQEDDSIELVAEIIDQEMPETISSIALNADFAAYEGKVQGEINSSAEGKAQTEEQRRFKSPEEVKQEEVRYEEAKAEERAEAPYEKFQRVIEEIARDDQPLDVNSQLWHEFWENF